MRKSTRPGRSSGFSLVELMLALALGLVVVTGIVQLFVGNSRTYEVLTGQARMQENARFALEFIAQAARSAGYFGCSLDRSRYVNGLGGDWQNIPDREWDITQMVQAEDGRILFRTIRRSGHRLTEVLQPDGNPHVVVPAAGLDFETGDVVVLANCEQGAVFRVTGITASAGEAELLHRPGGGGACLGSSYVSSGNAQCVYGIDIGVPVAYTLSKLNRSYGVDSQIGMLENTAFYIAPGMDGNDSLWQEVNGDANELVSGVEALDIRFGLDTNPGDADRRAGRYVAYAELPDPNDLSDVVALRVSVTVNSINAVTEDGALLRRTVGKTIALRNANPEA